MDERRLTRRDVLRHGGLGAGGAVLSASPWGAAVAAGGPSRPEDVDAGAATAWFELALRLVKSTPGFSLPVAARALAYSGIALYEAVAPGSLVYCALHGALPGMPRIVGAPGRLAWPLVANAAMASVLRSLFPTAGESERQAIDELEAAISAEHAGAVPPSLVERSRRWGGDVADVVFDWSTTDGGHEGYLRKGGIHLGAVTTTCCGGGLLGSRPAPTILCLLHRSGDPLCATSRRSTSHRRVPGCGSRPRPPFSGRCSLIGAPTGAW